MLSKPVRAVGISWFREEDYLRALGIMEDPGTLPATYLEWRRKAEKQEGAYQARGFLVIRAVIDQDEFPAWCRTRGLNVDADGRRLFAAWIAMRQVEQTH